MIYDKIKIYVTAHIADVLEKDAESFEFFKKDGKTPNKNAFLSRLVVNYSDEYNDGQAELFSLLKNTVQKHAHLQERALQELCFAIGEKINARAASPENEKFDKLVSLKPTKDTQPIVDYIETYCLNGCSLSEYFRNMFAAYAALPQDKRESILCKRQREALLQAIKEKRKVFLTVSHDKKSTMELSPYALSTTKEELHCYVLGHDGHHCIPLRLSRVDTVTVLNERAEFTDLERSVFEKMLTYGPQFLCAPNEEEVRVELTERGVKKFRKMYVHRPIPSKIEGSVYSFNCSYNQIFIYFTRFGSDAYILSPERLRSDMHRFHTSASNHYFKRLRKGENHENKNENS